jgi:hypothetical protein
VNYVRLQSDPGDYIGAGQTFEYNQTNSVFTVTANAGTLHLHIDGDQWWYGDFQEPSSLSRWQVGSYTGLQRYPFHDPAVGGLAWYGEGRGCNTLTGSFTVDSVTYTQNALTAIGLHFEQHCEGGSTALHGAIYWRSDDASRPPGPVMPIPAQLWRPPSGSTPASGNYVYVSSDVGDYIGQGQTNTYTTVNVSTNGGLLGVSTQSFGGSFQAMNSLTKLETGYYPDLHRYPFHNPAKGGLDWSGEGRGCNTLTGWFVVDGVTYAADTLTTVELRFEQHCEGGAPALHGAIRWSR